jgi:hypothetical protein
MPLPGASSPLPARYSHATRTRHSHACACRVRVECVSSAFRVRFECGERIRSAERGNRERITPDALPSLAERSDALEVRQIAPGG